MAFRAAVQPVEYVEPMDQVWTTQPVGSFSEPMTLEQALNSLPNQEAQLVEPVFQTMVIESLPPELEIVTLPQVQVPKFQHPLLKYNLVGR